MKHYYFIKPADDPNTCPLCGRPLLSSGSSRYCDAPCEYVAPGAWLTDKEALAFASKIGPWQRGTLAAPAPDGQ